MSKFVIYVAIGVALCVIPVDHCAGQEGASLSQAFFDAATLPGTPTRPLIAESLGGWYFSTSNSPGFGQLDVWDYWPDSAFPGGLIGVPPVTGFAEIAYPAMLFSSYKAVVGFSPAGSVRARAGANGHARVHFQSTFFPGQPQAISWRWWAIATAVYSVGGNPVRFGYPGGSQTLAIGESSGLLTGTQNLPNPGFANLKFGVIPPNVSGYIRAGMTVDFDVWVQPILSGSVSDPAPALVADKLEISVATGGYQALYGFVPPTFAGSLYAIIGSASGTGPTGLPGGVSLPLTLPDSYFEFAAGLLNTPPYYTGTFGTLSPNGQSTSILTVPPLPPGFAGTSLHHALIVVDSVGGIPFASNAVPLLFTP